MISLKPTHKPIRQYYKELQTLQHLNFSSEGNISPAFANLLRYYGRKCGLELVEQYPLDREGHQNRLRPDGALINQFKMIHGLWEAKDTHDDLDIEIRKKFKQGYPKDNILFQSPQRAMIWQNGDRVFDEDITIPQKLINALEIFFEYYPKPIEGWDKAVEEFKEKIPELGAGLLHIIRTETTKNKKFSVALQKFTDICRSALNPNLSNEAVEEMLIQHLLTQCH